MSVNLQKGQKVNLVKQDSLAKLTVGLGWDVNMGLYGSRFDLDAHAYLLNAEGKLASSSHHVYYGNLTYKDAVVHSGDNLTGAGAGDDEQIKVDIAHIPADVTRIRFAVKIYKAEERRQSFGRVNNAFIRVFSPTEEMCRFNLTDNYKDEIIMVVGEMYRHGDDWKFNAVGEGYNSEQAFTDSMR